MVEVLVDPAPPVLITALWAAVFILWQIWLAFRVIGRRRAKQIAFGDDGDVGTLRAMRAHANFIENVWPVVILLGLIELNGGHWAVPALLGFTLAVGRWFHQTAMLAKDDLRVPDRRRGMILTFLVQVLAAVILLVQIVVAHLGFSA